MDEREPHEAPDPTPAEPDPGVEDTELEVGWDEKGISESDSSTLDGVPVEDTAEPLDWLEEGDVVVQR